MEVGISGPALVHFDLNGLCWQPWFLLCPAVSYERQLQRVVPAPGEEGNILAGDSSLVVRLVVNCELSYLAIGWAAQRACVRMATPQPRLPPAEGSCVLSIFWRMQNGPNQGVVVSNGSHHISILGAGAREKEILDCDGLHCGQARALTGKRGEVKASDGDGRLRQASVGSIGRWAARDHRRRDQVRKATSADGFS